MADKQQLIELQNKIVHCLADAMDKTWEFLVVNFETAEIDGVRERNTIAISFVKEHGMWKRVSFIAPYESCNLLGQLCELMAMDGGKVWGSCTLEVESIGTYRYSFCYEAPKRLNGVFDDEALLKTYIPRPI